ncbi:MAG: hypothetical protein ABI560_05755 [Myxococcales bacterium]
MLGARGPSSVKFSAVTSARGELLRSPVSGTPCVHWRLRVVEQVNGTLQLVHEIASPDDFDVSWSGTGSQGALGLDPAVRGALPGLVKFRVVPHSARIEATPVLHRPGSPGALATARQFGFLGHLSVEEVTLRAGEEIVAEGILEETWDVPAGPFRSVARELELFEATVRLPARAALAPVLLPWALGTAAALLGGVGVAAWAARRFDLLPDMNQRMAPPTAEIGPLVHTRRHYSRPE